MDNWRKSDINQSPWTKLESGGAVYNWKTHRSFDLRLFSAKLEFSWSISLLDSKIEWNLTHRQYLNSIVIYINLISYYHMKVTAIPVVSLYRYRIDCQPEIYAIRVRWRKNCVFPIVTHHIVERGKNVYTQNIHSNMSKTYKWLMLRREMVVYATISIAHIRFGILQSQSAYRCIITAYRYSHWIRKRIHVAGISFEMKKHNIIWKFSSISDGVDIFQSCARNVLYLKWLEICLFYRSQKKWMLPKSNAKNVFASVPHSLRTPLKFLVCDYVSLISSHHAINAIKIFEKNWWFREFWKLDFLHIAQI